MAGQESTLDSVRRSSARRLLFLPHAVRQMSRPDRMITREEVREAVEHGELIEDYPDDPRGHSCLVLGCGSLGRAIHVVCAPRVEYLAVITAYLPASEAWDDGFKVRKRP